MLERALRRALPSVGPSPTCGQLALILQSNPNPVCYFPTFTFHGLAFQKLYVVRIFGEIEQYILLKCKIENNLPSANFTASLEKTHLLTLEMIFIKSSWRVHM